MEEVEFPFNDVLLLFAAVFSATDVIADWNKFGSCYRPVHVWLMVLYAIIFVLRGGHYLSLYLTSNPADEFFFFSDRPPPPLWLQTLNLGFVFPFFVAWTVVGTVWFSEVLSNTPLCLPRESHAWYVMFWLMMCYLWTITYVLVVVMTLITEVRARQEQSDMRMIETDELISRWGRFHVMGGYGGYLFRTGLSPNQIVRLPHESLVETPPTEPSCSICLEDFKTGDEVRMMQTCGHTFHQSCIDIWLLRSASCPNCKGVVNPGGSVWDL